MTPRTLGPEQINPYHHLYDLNTEQDLGPATNGQVAWSDQSEAMYGDELGGAFVIDADGDWVRFGSTITNVGQRAVYTDYPERH